MKYKVGDKVKIKSKEWYEKKKDFDGDVVFGDMSFIHSMVKYLGRDAVVKECLSTHYVINIDSGRWCWTDEMFEDAGCRENECEKEDLGQIVTLPAPSDPQALLNQISILTHTLEVLRTTGRAKSVSIVEEKIMGLIQGL